MGVGNQWQGLNPVLSSQLGAKRDSRYQCLYWTGSEFLTSVSLFLNKWTVIVGGKSE